MDSVGNYGGGEASTGWRHFSTGTVRTVRSTEHWHCGDLKAIVIIGQTVLALAFVLSC